MFQTGRVNPTGALVLLTVGFVAPSVHLLPVTRTRLPASLARTLPLPANHPTRFHAAQIGAETKAEFLRVFSALSPGQTAKKGDDVALLPLLPELCPSSGKQATLWVVMGGSWKTPIEVAPFASPYLWKHSRLPFQSLPSFSPGAENATLAFRGIRIDRGPRMLITSGDVAWTCKFAGHAECLMKPVSDGCIVGHR